MSPLLLSLLLLTTSPPDAPFLAGACTSNITPALGSSLNGGMSDRSATQIHDELHARCLVLDDGKTRLAFAVCDLCMIPRDIVLDAKRQIQEKTGIPPENVLISATHSHSCPTCAGVFQSDTVPGFPEFAARRIADGIARAAANLAPAQIAWGFGSNDRQVFNRRWFLKPGTPNPDPFGKGTDQVRMNPPVGSPHLVEPAGPIDPRVSVLAVRSADGRRPLAVLANYSLHYVGDTGPGHVSADYFGAFADRLQDLLQADRLDPPFVGIMSNGTSGDINNINFRGGQTGGPPYTKIRAVADDLAQEAARVYRSLQFRDHVPLSSATTELQLGVRKPMADELTRANEILSRAKSTDGVLDTLDEIYARESVLLADYPDTVPVTLQALRLGDLSIAAIPCEVFVQIGLALQAQSPAPSTFVVSLANGYNGYLPTKHHHSLGGYETWRARSSYLEVDAADKIQSGLLDLLRQLTPSSP